MRSRHYTLSLHDALPISYAALGSPAAIDYFKKLCVTAVELLPVHAHIDDKVLVDRSLTNYWGYNTIGFFAPHAQRSEEHTSELQSLTNLVCRLLLEKKKQ